MPPKWADDMDKDQNYGEERDPGYPYGQFDAALWVEEFDRLFPKKRPDNDTMLGWFANAIMTGYDTAKREDGV